MKGALCTPVISIGTVVLDGYSEGLARVEIKLQLISASGIYRKSTHSWGKFHRYQLDIAFCPWNKLNTAGYQPWP